MTTIPSITLKNEMSIEKAMESIFKLLPYFISPPLAQLTINEMNILVAAALLPDKLINTPFSLTPKRLYQKWFNLTSSNLGALINNLESKGYLTIDEYGEKDFNDTIKGIIKMIKVCPVFEFKVQIEIDKTQPKNEQE